MDSNFRNTALPNQNYQIPFLHVYVSFNNRRLQFLKQSLIHQENCIIAEKNLQINLRSKIIEDFIEERQDTL